MQPMYAWNRVQISNVDGDNDDNKERKMNESQ